MLNELKKQVLSANLALPAQGLVLFTWGNVSGIDRDNGLVVIKPSGVEYAELTEEKMVIVNMDGQVVEGDYRPSSDTPTHLALYRATPPLRPRLHRHKGQSCLTAPPMPIIFMAMFPVHGYCMRLRWWKTTRRIPAR